MLSWCTQDQNRDPSRSAAQVFTPRDAVMLRGIQQQQQATRFSGQEHTTTYLIAMEPECRHRHCNLYCSGGPDSESPQLANEGRWRTMA